MTPTLSLFAKTKAMLDPNLDPKPKKKKAPFNSIAPKAKKKNVLSLPQAATFDLECVPHPITLAQTPIAVASSIQTVSGAIISKTFFIRDYYHHDFDTAVNLMMDAFLQYQFQALEVNRKTCYVFAHNLGRYDG